VLGLDANFAEQTVVITMNGTGATSATTETFTRVYRTYVSSCGTYGGSNIGQITIRASGAGTSFQRLEATKGQTQTAHYCVPAGRTVYISDIHLSVDSTKAMDIFFYMRQNADDVSSPYSAKRLIQEFDGIIAPQDFEYQQAPMMIPAKTDLWFTGKVSAGTGKASIEYLFIEDTA
jgi:hypothetical protein